MMTHSLKTISSILLLNASLAFAGTSNGFYLGGDIGLAGLVNKEIHYFNYETHQLGTLGLVGGGFVGYQHCLSDLTHLNLEVFADGMDLNPRILHVSSNPSVSFSYFQRQRYDVGVRLLPQYTFSQTTRVHVILGYINGRFNIDDGGVYGYVYQSYNQNGFQTGVGFTSCLTDYLSLRFDEIYSIYGSQSYVAPSLTVGTNQIYSNTFSSLTSQLSLIYTFV